MKIAHMAETTGLFPVLLRLNGDAISLSNLDES